MLPVHNKFTDNWPILVYFLGNALVGVWETKGGSCKDV